MFFYTILFISFSKAYLCTFQKQKQCSLLLHNDFYFSDDKFHHQNTYSSSEKTKSFLVDLMAAKTNYERELYKTHLEIQEQTSQEIEGKFMTILVKVYLLLNWV